MGAMAANLAALCLITEVGLKVLLLMAADFPNPALPLGVQIDFIVQHHQLLYVWYLVTCLAAGIALLLLNLVLQQIWSGHQSTLPLITTVIGMIWVVLLVTSGLMASKGICQVLVAWPENAELAAMQWLVIQQMVASFATANQFFGGSWLLLTNWLARRQQLYGLWLSVVAMITGCAGLLSLVPNQTLTARVFSGGCILWFAAITIALLNFRLSLATDKQSI